MVSVAVEIAHEGMGMAETRGRLGQARTQSAHPRIGRTGGIAPQNSVGLASAYEERERNEHGHKVQGALVTR
jgi:hypothetical protein